MHYLGREVHPSHRDPGMSCYPADLRPGDLLSLAGCDYELISIDRTDDFYSLYIEHLDTRGRALIVVHSSVPITRLN